MATITSTKYGDLCYKFYYTIEKTKTPGKSKVTWKFYSTGGSTSSTPGSWAYSSYDILVSITTGTKSSGTVPNYDASWAPVNFYPENPSYNGYDIVKKEGYFYINHTTAGAAAFKVTMKTAIYSSTVNTITKTVTLDTNKPYTACSAPTSFSIGGLTSGYFKSTATSLTLSWSGAKAGTANSIKGYEIFYEVNGNTLDTNSPSVTVNSTSTSGSTTIPLPKNPENWQSIKFAILTLGSAGGSYNSGFSSSKPSATKNIRPSAPTVSVNKSTVSSTGGTVTFTTKPGTDNDDQTLSVYYSTTSTGTKKIVSNNSIKLTVNSAQTYYFWTYDGLEYSENSASETITINTPPEPTTNENVIKVSGTEYEYNLEEYLDNFSFTINGTLFRNSESNLTYKIEIYNQSNSKYFTVKTGSLPKDNDATEITNIYIGNYITPGNSYNFKVSIIDEYLDSWSYTSGSYTLVPTNNEAIQVYNTHAFENIERIDETKPDIFSKKLRVVFPKDDRYNTTATINYTVSDSNNNVKESNTTSLIINEDKYYCDVNFTSIFESDVSYNFEFAITQFNITRSYSFSRTQVSRWEIIDGINIDRDTDTETSSIFSDFAFSIIANDIIESIDDTIQIKENYYIKEQQITFTYQNQTYSISLTPSDSSTDASVNYLIKKAEILKVADKIGIRNTIGTFTTTLQLVITNEFDDNYIYNGSVNFIIDKGEAWVEIITFELDSNYSNQTNFYEKDTIKWNYEFNSYYNQEIKYEIYYSTENSRELLYSNSISALTGTTEGTEIYSFKDTIEYTLGEIKETKNINSFILVIYNQNNISKESEGLNVIITFHKFITPSYQIKNINYNNNDDETGIVKINYNTSISPIDEDISISPTYTYTLEYYEESSKEDKSSSGNESSPGILEFSIRKFDAETLDAILKIKVDLTENLSKEVEYSVLIYNISPVLKLGTHQVGINIKEFDKVDDINEVNSVLTIRSYNNYKKIRMINAEDEIEITINLEEGSITGAIIDGGTW